MSGATRSACETCGKSKLPGYVLKVSESVEGRAMVNTYGPCPACNPDGNRKP